MQFKQMPEVRLVFDDQHLVAAAGCAPRAGVFQARSNPASDQSCTVRSETPRRSAASRVEQTFCPESTKRLSRCIPPLTQ